MSDPAPTVPKTRAPKSGADEIRSRLQEVLDVLIETLSGYEARMFAMKRWGIGPKQARRYVVAAERLMRADRWADKARTKIRLTRRLAKVAEAAAAEGDRGVEVRALELLAKIEGVVDPSPAARLVAQTTTTTVVSDRGALVARQVERLSMLGDEQLDAVERALLRVTVDAPAESSPVALPPGPGPGQGQGQGQ